MTETTTRRWAANDAEERAIEAVETMLTALAGLLRSVQEARYAAPAGLDPDS